MGTGRANGLHKRRKPTRLVDGLIKGFFDLFHASIVDRKSINESAPIYRMEKMSIHAIIRSHRLRLGMTEQQLADRVGVTRAAVQQWEREGGTAPRRTKQADVAAALGISLSELLGTAETGAMLPTPAPAAHEPSNVAPAPALRASRQIPVVGEVKGGDHGYLDELQYPVGYGEGTVDFPSSDPMAYALRVRGDSMHPRYRAGEFVVVEPSVEALPGDDVVVALVDGRKLLKELGWCRDGELQLLSVNNHFGPMTLERAWIASIHLVAGRVRRCAINK